MKLVENARGRLGERHERVWFCVVIVHGAIMDERTAKVSAKIAKGRASMSSAASVTREAAVALVSHVEKRKRSRMLAYDFIASHIGRSTSWVRGFISQGMGRIDAEIGRTIDALLIEEMKAEARRLEHELEMARQSGVHPASQHVGEISAHLARVRSLMREG